MLNLNPLRLFLSPFPRTFTTTAPLPKKHSKRRLQHLLRNVPTYPYPIHHTFKQAWFGLYGGKHIQFGNNVPESQYKTRRFWLPNVRKRSVYSRALGMHFTMHVTAAVLRTIDKVGGLDAYLTGHKPARIKDLGPTGWRLRWRILNSPSFRRARNEERKALGLVPTLEAPVAPPKATGEALEVQQVEVLEVGLEGVPRQKGMLETVEAVLPLPVKKTPAQLLVERIEREKGLRE